MITRHSFREVAITRTKTGKCPHCGKSARRTEKFWQTINPYNRNAEGFVKTPGEITLELERHAMEWEAQIVEHAKCAEGLK